MSELDKIIKQIVAIDDKDVLVQLYLAVTGETSYTYKKTIRNPCLSNKTPRPPLTTTK